MQSTNTYGLASTPGWLRHEMASAEEDDRFLDQSILRMEAEADKAAKRSLLLRERALAAANELPASSYEIGIVQEPPRRDAASRPSVERIHGARMSVEETVLDSIAEQWPVSACVLPRTIPH